MPHRRRHGLGRREARGASPRQGIVGTHQPPDPRLSAPLRKSKTPSNHESHCRSPGPEIWDHTDGTVDVLVSGIGTGGTISGGSRFIKKERGKKILSVGVEPVNSQVITQYL